jgi:glycosyltransferase involved in cell wall biosynthesis
MLELSVIIPIKDERDNLAPLYAQLSAVLRAHWAEYEIVFVDDGSVDDSFAILTELAAADPCVKVVRLRRNFGQSAALQAGIDCSQGAVLVTMDGDLQNDPTDIPRLVKRLNEGYDAVLGLRAQRQDGLLLRKVPSWIANFLIRRVTGSPFRDFGCTLRAMRRDLADSLPLYGEMHRFIPALAQQYGARMTQLPVAHHPRRAGQTKYNLTRSLRVLLDLMTLQFLHSYLARPMHVLGSCGLFCIGCGIVSLLATVAMKWTSGIFMTGNPLLLLSVMFVLIGFQSIGLGLLGELLSRTYFESQGKTAYAVRDVLNLESLPSQRRRAA